MGRISLLLVIFFSTLTASDEILVPQLKGIALWGSLSEVRPEGVLSSGVIVGKLICSDVADLRKTLENFYIELLSKLNF